MNNKQIASALCLALALGLGGVAQAATGNAQAGAKKNSMCLGCHGIPGYKTAYPTVYNVPKIGGQHADYIAAALQGYKTGSRKHPTMTAIAAQLSEQDIADLAAYYAGKQ
ncbi:cytochrome c [Chitinimonas sp. BJYL2]|uniref:c-type cytochrome n=1 Tax=Chitinimonas sp. BJYL2 TaxID=2976696 RepID=UPI0022B57CE3|nr:cytochrome c [Chitinimonas sp. BJYL2]